LAPASLSKNKRTLVRYAREAGKSVLPSFDSLHGFEQAMAYFYVRGLNGRLTGAKKEMVDADYVQAATMAEALAPYLHSRFSAVKLAGDPNNSIRMFKEETSSDELRAEILLRPAILQNAWVIDLQALRPAEA
jgi:hypothetical protein